MLPDMSVGNIVAAVLFSCVGFVALTYGKKNAEPRAMGLGVALMSYSYFVTNVYMNWLVGIVLTAALVLWKD